MRRGQSNLLRSSGSKPAGSKISRVWAEPDAMAPYISGVSLHSHTSLSEETLSFVQKALEILPGLKGLFAHYGRRSRDSGVELDFVRGHWRPPLVPRMAYDLESAQIHELGLRSLISITDHDTIAASQLLRSLPIARGIPVSVEWSVPFGATEFHLGIHNLPSSAAYAWMDRLRAYTSAPTAGELHDILHEIDAMAGSLIVLNHPVWDLHKIGASLHKAELMRFLEEHGNTVHAMELNGLRDGQENRQVARLAHETGYLLISGGDRHGTEPSACINLSHAQNFREFVEEVRVERQSHVLFLEQYRSPWAQRILHSTLDAVTDFPEFTEGWRRWDDRAFHPDRDGVMRPLSQLWAGGVAPWPLRGAIEALRLGRNRAFSRALGMAFRDTTDVLGEAELS